MPPSSYATVYYSLSKYRILKHMIWANSLRLLDLLYVEIDDNVCIQMLLEAMEQTNAHNSPTQKCLVNRAKIYYFIIFVCYTAKTWYKVVFRAMVF